MIIDRKGESNMNMSKNMILDRLRTIYDSCGSEDTKKQILDLIIDIGKDNNSNLAITWDNGSTIKGIPCDYRDYNSGPGVGPHTGTGTPNGYPYANISSGSDKNNGFRFNDIFSSSTSENPISDALKSAGKGISELHTQE